MPDKDVSLVLGKYGKVKRVIREKFPAELGLDMFTGVRGVYMDVEKRFPPRIISSIGRGTYSILGIRIHVFIARQWDTR